MTWSLFWKMAGLFVLVIIAKERANSSEKNGSVGSFTLWIAVMLGSIFEMIVLVS